MLKVENNLILNRKKNILMLIFHKLYDKSMNYQAF